MKLLDVNVLLYAHRGELAPHDEIHAWFEGLLNGESAFGFAREVLSSYLRVATHPRIFDPPTPLEHALGFVEAMQAAPNSVLIEPGPRHWEIFIRLCRAADARGNLIPDAYLAALAIESGSEWITTDRDFSRFPGLVWSHPLSGD